MRGWQGPTAGRRVYLSFLTKTLWRKWRLQRVRLWRLLRKGDLARAIDAQERQAIAFGADPRIAKGESAALRREFSNQGARGYWLSRQKALASSSSTDPYDMAVVQARLGETDAMFGSLEK